ncbi:gypsy type transposase [Tanacetum coccineum]
MVCSNTSMEYIPLYDTDKGFNVMPSSFCDVGDVEFQDNWGRVWVDIGTSDYFALDVLLNCLTVLSLEQASSSYVSIHNVIDVGSLPRMLLGLQKAYHVRLISLRPCQHGTGLSFGLLHYRIHISQLSVIGAAKVSHFEILCRVHGFEPTVGLFHSLKSWNDHFFWVDAFACPTFFPWNTSKSASKDPFPKPSKYNAEHYATLVAYSAPFHKYPEPFLCLIGISCNYTLDEDTYPQFLSDNNEEMDLLSFIRTADPTKVRVGERQRPEGKPKLLDTTVGHVVLLLPVAPARASSKLEASVEKLFDEGVSSSHTERGDSVEIVAEDMVLVQPKRQRKRKTVDSDAGEASHPPKKLREDHGTSTGPFVVDSSYHSGANIVEAEVDSFARPSVLLMTMATTITSMADQTTTTKERFCEPSIFGGGSSSGAEHTVGGFSGLTSSDFIIGGIDTVVSPNTDLQKVYIPQWSVTNGSWLDDGRTCREMVDEFAPPKFFASIRGMEHDQLFMEFNEKYSLLKARDEEIKSLKAQLLVKETEAAKAIHLRAKAYKFEVVEKSLHDEIKSLKECNTSLEKETSVLDVKVADLAATVKVREQETTNSDAMLTTVKLQNDRLADQVRELETSSAGLQENIAVYENCMSQLEKFQDEQMTIMHEKFNKLDADFIETCLHLEETFYPHLLTTIVGHRWLLTYGMKLAVFKCLNSLKYLSALGAAISKAIKKGMQDGVEAVMDPLRLDEALTERLGLNDSHPHVDQLMILVHHSPDQTVISARSLSLSLDVSHAFVYCGLEGTGGTSSVAPDTTTALSVTLASASTIPPISIDDYEIAHVEDQGNAGADVDTFLNVDDVELIIS